MEKIEGQEDIFTGTPSFTVRSKEHLGKSNRFLKVTVALSGLITPLSLMANKLPHIYAPSAKNAPIQC